MNLLFIRNGEIHEQTYERGKPLAPAYKLLAQHKKHGTLVRFMPDPEIFTETTDFSFETLVGSFARTCFFNKKLRIIILMKRINKKHEFYFEGGIVSFIEHINKKKTPLFPEVIYFDKR